MVEEKRVMRVIAQAIHASRPDPGRMLQEAMDRGAWPGPLFNRRMQHLSNELNRAVTTSRTFESVRNYNYERHRVKTNPVERLEEVFGVTRIQTEQIAEYRNTRDYFTRLYNALRDATIEHRDIASLWGDPYLELVKHWDRVETERKQKLQREYQEMEDIAQKIEKDREEFRRIVDRVLNNPIDRFIDEVAVPVFVFATFKHPAPACVSLAATARVVAPRIGQVATALGTAEISRELTTFFNKKAGSDPTPRADRSYGSGEYWDRLITDRDSAIKSGVKAKDVDTILSRIQKAKREIGGDIRADAAGNLYKFDKAHQSAKVHLERIVKRADGFYGTAEVDPITGVITKVLKKARKLIK